MTSQCTRCATLAALLNEILAAHAEHSTESRRIPVSRDITDFIGERCVTAPGYRETFTGLYRAYTRWCPAYGVTPASMRTFGITLARLGFQGVKGSGGVRMRVGIKVMPQ